jgi:hypothetical protein
LEILGKIVRALLEYALIFAGSNMSIEALILCSIAGLMVWAVIRHLNISRRAFLTAYGLCQKEGLTLLDQSVLLKKIRLSRSKQSLFAIRREYSFEFSTVGDQRYRGQMVFIGSKRVALDLDAYKPSVPGAIPY